MKKLRSLKIFLILFACTIYLPSPTLNNSAYASDEIVEMTQKIDAVFASQAWFPGFVSSVPLFPGTRYALEIDGADFLSQSQTQKRKEFLAVTFSQSQFADLPKGEKNILRPLKSLQGVFDIGSLVLVRFRDDESRFPATVEITSLARVSFMQLLQTKKTGEVLISVKALPKRQIKNFWARMTAWVSKPTKKKREEITDLYAQVFTVTFKIYDLVQKSYQVERHQIEMQQKNFAQMNDNAFIDAIAAGTTRWVSALHLQSIFEEKYVEEALSKLELTLTELVDKLYQELQFFEQQIIDKKAQANAPSSEKALNFALKRLDPAGDDVEGFKQKLNSFHVLPTDSVDIELGIDTPNISQAVFERIEGELKKLEQMPQISSEYFSQKKLVERMLNLPWGQYSKVQTDLTHAREVLKANHFGLDEVKERILEILAVSTLKGSSQGLVLCLVGPPGVGKTSIGESIAKATGRKFFKFNAGGLDDARLIKGFFKTYVGAEPGMVVDALEKTKVFNPLIMLDEVDKIATHTWHGSPIAALLELLDPTSQSAFFDEHLGLPLDVSQFMFVCTANDVSDIPVPLLDRMEVVFIEAYQIEEKVKIARDYVIPKIKRSLSVDTSRTLAEIEAVQISDQTLEALIMNYAPEPGVRRLEQSLGRIFHKLVLKLLAGEIEKGKDIEITPTDLEGLLGPKKHRKETLYKVLPPGVSIGLSVNNVTGGGIMYLESRAILNSQDKKLTLTGQLRDIMQESALVAYRFANSYYRDLLAQGKGLGTDKDANDSFFDQVGIHLHCPEGSTPKDGPSAGIAMATTFLSLAMNKNVPSDLAMTGEISLNGKVMPVGGIKSKAMGAKANGIKKLILPAANRADWDQLRADEKDGLEVHFVSDYSEVFAIAFAEPIK